jgi:hypothetical protein
VRGVRGAFRKTTFHFFLIDERLVDSRTSRSALIRSSNMFTGSSFGSCGHKLAAERFCEDRLIEMIDQFAGASGFYGDAVDPSERAYHFPNG